MLKILQTGDLHLGKIFYEHSLLEDQKYVLEQIIQELQSESDKNEPYNALLITGDIYDRAVAPSEAITLFDSFLVSAHAAFPTLPICIISGNHDSAKRMSFATSLLEAQNIYICTRAEDCTKPILLYPNQETKQKAPLAALYQLPFLYTGDFSALDGTVLHTQNELVTEAVRKIKIAHKQLQKSSPELAKIPALLNAHLNSLPASASDISIGTAGFVNPSIFDFFEYVALGHIHKPLSPAKNACYAGSPIEISFKNTGKNKPALQKHFLRIQIDTSEDLGSLFDQQNRLTMTKLPIKPLHPVLRLESTFDDFENGTYKKLENFGISQEDLANAYLEITCTDTVLVENPLSRLQKHYPLTMAINQQALKNINFQQSFKERRELFEDSPDIEKIDNAKLFSAFIADIFPEEKGKDWEDAKKLFLEKIQ